MSRPFTPWTVAFGTALLWAQNAEAGPVEDLVEVALHPTDPALMVLRYKNAGDGLLYTRDQGATWALLCGDFIDPGFNGGPIVMTGDGTLVMGGTAGLREGQDGGCSWSKPYPLPADVWINDVAIQPGEPEIAFAVTMQNAEGALSGLLRRDPNGGWSEYGSRDAVLPQRLRAAATPGGIRFYQDSLTMVDYRPLIRVSDDEGATWEEFPTDALGDGDASGNGTPRLRGVDPTDPDRIVVSVTHPAGGESIFVSADRGATFSEYMTLKAFGGIAFAPDGRVWIGDQGTNGDPEGAGIWSAPSLDVVPSHLLSDVSVRCLAYGVGGVLYACKFLEFGTVDMQSGAFSSLFSFSGATDFLACEGTDIATTCQTQLCSGYCGPGHFAQAPLCCVYDDPYCGPRLLEPDQVQCEGWTPGDAGSSEGAPETDAGATDGSRAAPTASGGCACTSAGRAPGAPLLSLVSFLALWVVRRRRG